MQEATTLDPLINNAASNGAAAQPPAPFDLAAVNARFTTAAPDAILQWAAEQFAGGLLMTSSFGAESMCLIHMATRVVPHIPVVFVNTGYLFPETLRFMETMRHRFNLNVQEFHTSNDPVIWLSVNGEPDPRVRNNVEACCAANKNEVFDRAMRQLAPTAWLRGVRADQSDQRAKMQPVQFSRRNNCWAISPLLNMSVRHIHAYMKAHDLPYHPLWEKGYTSIGCNPATCTRAVGADEDQRGGRWSGSDKKECGIHLDLGAGI